MHNSATLKSPTVFEEAASRGVIPSHGAFAFPQRGTAGNDEACADPAIPKGEPESSPPTSYELYHAARAQRSLIVGDIVAAVLRSIGSIARRAYARHRQRRDARDTYEALRHLDDRMLRDLGFDRSELTSIAAEASGAAARTRLRLLLMSHSSP